MWFVAQGRNISLLAAMPGAEVIASVTPLRPAEEARLRDLQVKLEAELRAADRLDLSGLLDAAYPSPLGTVPGIDPDDVRELAPLNATGIAQTGVATPSSRSRQADAPHHLARW